MSKKIWSMSTTVRNPNRIKDFLSVLLKMDGKEWNKETQIEYQTRLIQERFYVPTIDNLNQNQIDILQNALYSISYKEAYEILKSKQYVDADMRGRTSYKPLEKWGLAFILKGKISISETGFRLLNGESDIGDVCFKSLLKWQYPNPIDNDFKELDGYNIKPFVAILHLINEVNNLCTKRNLKVKGISKEELGIFALSLINYKDIKQTAIDLLKFREEYEKLESKGNARKECIIKWCKDYLQDYDNASYKNVKDYTDNIIRYFRLTRYLYIRGNGYYIDIEPRRLREILLLLKEDNASALCMDEKEYVEYLSNYNLPYLPWETKEILQNIIKDIEADIKTKTVEFHNNENVNFKDITKLNIEELKEYIKYLRNIRTKINNLELKLEYSEQEKIDEAIKNINNIFKSTDKASIALEKWINVALNIINDAKLIKPNYPVGDDNEPTFTAPSNVPDIECYYKDFSSICEVTMLTNRSQWYNEGQPVQRHLRDFEDKQTNDNVYCLFVAPRMHRDTINTFWTANKYEYEGKKQKIIPFNLGQITVILEYIKEIKLQGKTFTNDKLRLLYESVIENINNVSNSDEWIQNMSKYIEDWKKAV